MKTAIILLSVCMLALASALPSSAADAVVLRGEYDWSSGGSDELIAEFTPNGEGEWDVTFRFRFGGESNTWNGSAQGDLTDGGEVTGTVTWKESGRRWVFDGSVESGELRGSHAEVRGGKESKSGTFRLAL